MRPKSTAIIVLRCLGIFMLVQMSIGVLTQIITYIQYSDIGGRYSPFSLIGLLAYIPHILAFLLLWFKAESIADTVTRYLPLELMDKLEEFNQSRKS